MYHNLYFKYQSMDSISEIILVTTIYLQCFVIEFREYKAKDSETKRYLWQNSKNITMEGSYTCDQLIKLVSRDFPTPSTYKLGLSLYVIVTFEEYIQILSYMYDLVHLFLSKFSVHMQLSFFPMFHFYTHSLFF